MNRREAVYMDRQDDALVASAPLSRPTAAPYGWVLLARDGSRWEGASRVVVDAAAAQWRYFPAIPAEFEARFRGATVVRFHGPTSRQFYRWGGGLPAAWACTALAEAHFRAIPWSRRPRVTFSARPEDGPARRRSPVSAAARAGRRELVAAVRALVPKVALVVRLLTPPQRVTPAAR